MTEADAPAASIPVIPGIPPEPEPSPPDTPALRTYDLPGARQIVTFGLSLAFRATSELRRASLYIGLLTLAIVGPPAVFAIEVVTKLHMTDPSAIGRLRDPTVTGLLLELITLLYAAIAGWAAVAIDAHLIAVALLGARASDRPYTLRDAVTRARQVFWRFVRGGIIAGLLVVMVELALTGIFVGIAGLRTFDRELATVVATLVASPLGYLSTGIVLGDVSALEALRRSIRLARTRPRIAIVVALFVAFTGALQSLALGSGLELVFDAAKAARRRPDRGIRVPCRHDPHRARALDGVRQPDVHDQRDRRGSAGCGIPRVDLLLGRARSSTGCRPIDAQVPLGHPPDVGPHLDRRPAVDIRDPVGRAAASPMRLAVA